MQDFTLFGIGFVLGLAISAIVIVILWNKLNVTREKFNFTEEQLRQAQEKIQDAERVRRENENLIKQVERLSVQQDWLNQAESRLRETFQALASEVLEKSLQLNSEEFLKKAKNQIENLFVAIKGDWQTSKQEIENLLQPFKIELDKLERQVKEIENKREQAYGSLEQYIKLLSQSHQELKTVTNNLLEAFRKSPTLRGTWGEIQLRRIVEITGMIPYVDFQEQLGTGDKRPDLIVNLPNGGVMIVDSKVPLQHFLDAIHALDDKTREEKLKEHAKAVRQTIQQLKEKRYWENFDKTANFVVMFIPHEHALSAAFLYNPNLLDEALSNGVLLASPITFIALLKVVSFGWMQQKAFEDTQEIIKNAKEAYKRFQVFSEHLSEIGKNLHRTVNAYNQTIGSLQSRVYPVLRKFEEIQIGEKELTPLDEINVYPREMQKPNTK